MNSSSYPSVSIVTICLNCASTIEKTIQSVLCQNYQNREYIVIDGGSADRTLEVLRNYANKIDVLVSEPDEGISDAFNKGIRLARGQYVHLLSGDDCYIDQNALAIFMSYAEQAKADVIHADVIRESVFGRMHVATIAQANLSALKREMVINHPATLIKRDVYLQAGEYRRDLKLAMDYELLLRLYLSGCSFLSIPQPLVLVSEAGISHRHRLRARWEVCRAQRMHGISLRSALLSLLWAYMRSSIREGLIGLGLDEWVQFYRRWYSINKKVSV